MIVLELLTMLHQAPWDAVVEVIDGDLYIDSELVPGL